MTSSGGMWRAPGGATRLPLQGYSGFVERDWVSGTCLLVRRECLDDIRGFDTTFFAYSEDVDFCLRAKDAGWRLGVECGALAHGLGSVSSKRLNLMYVNRVLLVRKRLGRTAAVYNWLGLATTTGGAFARSVLPWRPPESRGDLRSIAAQGGDAMLKLAFRGLRPARRRP